ncbi:MAG: peptidoglycan-binding protein [Nitrosomonas sp.]|nr:peptidoglycan-binding protein [Nitrosomonas sp.]
MKSKKISILASSTVLLLSVGLVSGCGDAEEENAAAPAIVAPVASGDATYDAMTDGSTAAIDDEAFSIEGLDEYEPIESISDMLEEAAETADEAIDNTIDSMLGMAESGAQATADLVEDTQETALAVIETIEEPQAQALDLIDDATDVVPATSAIIRGVQQSLTDAGLNPGPVDGMSGPRTVAAINDFQNQNNLAGGGQLTKETLRALGVSF